MHRQDPIPRHGWLKRCTYELGELAVRYEATVHGVASRFWWKSGRTRAPTDGILCGRGDSLVDHPLLES
jgi:hypothetical protein